MKNRIILVTLFFILSFYPLNSVDAQAELGQLTEEAFTAILEAEDAGGDVEGLISSLNEAILLIESGSALDLVEARHVLEGVLVDAEAVRLSGVQEGRVEAMVAIVKVVFLVGLAAVVWLRGDEYFWRLWRRTKRGYILE